MNWRQFEQLTGEAFRRQGYAVEETGLGGADGGIDLILRKDGLTTLVQCKQWQNRQVGVKVVREMYGLLLHHLAAGVKIVALGNYTTDARDFAQGKAIELIHGGELIATVRLLQTAKARATGPMDSPVALIGSMSANLLLIAGLSSSSAASTPAFAPAPILVQHGYQRAPLPLLRIAVNSAPTGDDLCERFAKRCATARVEKEECGVDEDPKADYERGAPEVVADSLTNRGTRMNTGIGSDSGNFPDHAPNCRSFFRLKSIHGARKMAKRE
jgi:hypothetical protein